MSARDPYEVLGIPPDSSAEDVKAAYRQKAKQLHPDVNKEQDAEEDFKELQAAYESALAHPGDGVGPDDGSASQNGEGPADARPPESEPRVVPDSADGDALGGCVWFFIGIAFPPAGIVLYFDKRGRDKFGQVPPYASLGFFGALMGLFFFWPIFLASRFSLTI